MLLSVHMELSYSTDGVGALQISNLRQSLQDAEGSDADEDQDAKFERLQAAVAEAAAAAGPDTQALQPDHLPSRAALSDVPSWDDDDDAAGIAPDSQGPSIKGQKQTKKSKGNRSMAKHQQHSQGGMAATDGVSWPATETRANGALSGDAPAGQRTFLPCTGFWYT